MKIYDMLENSVNKYPDKTAVRCAGKSYSYHELNDRVNCLVEVLTDLGIGTQDKVALMCSNSNAYLEILFACAKIGAVAVNHNLRFSSQVNMALMVETSPKILFVSSDQGGFLKTFKESALGNIPCIVIDDIRVPLEKDIVSREDADHSLDSSDAMYFYEELIEEVEVEKGNAKLVNNRSFDFQESSIAILYFTSGTTGLPRTVCHTHQSLIWSVMINAMEQRCTHDEVVLSEFPMCHIATAVMFRALYVGAELIIDPTCKVETIAKLIRDHKVTRLSIIPYLINKLVSYLEEESVTLNSLKAVSYGGESVSTGSFLRYQNVLNCDFYQAYGMTETAETIAVLLPEHHHDPKRLGTVGKPNFGVEIRVSDGKGNVCTPETIGEIQVRTKSLMSGYYEDSDYTSLKVKDEWFSTSDLGFFDKKGFLHLTGRQNDMIISGGENIYPSEVRACILGIGSDIVEAEVIGVPDKKWGEALAAVVVPHNASSLTEKDIIDHCANQLARFKKPRQVLFVNELPRSSTGKVMKSALKEMLENDMIYAQQKIERNNDEK